jgi:hypothetical protein
MENKPAPAPIPVVPPVSASKHIEVSIPDPRSVIHNPTDHTLSVPFNGHDYVLAPGDNLIVFTIHDVEPELLGEAAVRLYCKLGVDYEVVIPSMGLDRPAADLLKEAREQLDEEAKHNAETEASEKVMPPAEPTPPPAPEPPPPPLAPESE